MEDHSLFSSLSAYTLLFQAFSLIPITHYFLFFVFSLLIFLYNFLEIHFFYDFFTFFRGDPVSLTCNFSSEVYQYVGSKCKILQGRFCPTPWLSGPHLQTAFLSLVQKSPNVTYKRHLFKASDGGTIALDWLTYSDLVEQGLSYNDNAVPQDDKAPIVIVIPGLTSDSSSAYVKHIAFEMARRGRKVVVSNHRGLGGVSVTSDCFYNAAWTEDLRVIIDHIHCQYPEAPLYAVGTSIGANVLVKYLGEHGLNVPLIGAASICSPWDLLICDRFINRRFAQKLYNKVLVVGLQGYAQLHHSVLTRLVNVDGIKLSRSVREFDRHFTSVLGKYETVDTYYRHSTCVNFLRTVSVPLLCVSALDDPICTREAIPWDECRANDNIILATTTHGGHLAYYEGISASSMWWARAVDEFFHVLHSSPLRNRKVEGPELPVPNESSIDQGPYVNVMDDGMVAVVSNTLQYDKAEETCNGKEDDNEKGEEAISENEKNVNDVKETISEQEKIDNKTQKTHSEIDLKQPSDQNLIDLVAPIKRYMSQLAQHSRISVWLLAYIAIVTTWPVMRSALLLLFVKRKFRGINTPAALFGR